MAKKEPYDMTNNYARMERDKRKAIGAQFIRTFEKMGKQIGEQVGKIDYLAQGTIYPDVIESGAGDADAVAVGPVGSFRIDAGSGRNVGDKLGGHGAVVVQILVVVVTGGQCQCQRCEGKKSGLHVYLFFIFISSYIVSVTGSHLRRLRPPFPIR